ncbi:MAG: heme-binding domain-containing protein, partial [Pyrinomonadaceae bacterium]|nr:heme-binding domain-containing protein [Pyrinomonadaceae bacterium]
LEATTQVPEKVGQILKRSCSDCHTNQTSYPWYSNITPVNWLLAQHIDEGRQKLNFSIWNTYNAKRKGRKLDEICDQVIGGEMPYNQYLWMHGDSKLSDEDKRLLCNWGETEKAKIVE